MLQGNSLHPRPAEETLQMSAPVGAGERQGLLRAALPDCVSVRAASGGSESSACGRQAAARQAAAASSLTARLWHHEESSPLYLTIQT